MIVKIKNDTDFPVPGYETGGAAGMDLRANESVAIPPGARRLVKTGLSIELPQGYEAQIRPRSGLALKQGITVLNSPGTIDSDYRGEIGVILHNTSNIGVTIFKGDRIAQMVIAQYQRIVWEHAVELATSDRGEGGFGSTGK